MRDNITLPDSFGIEAGELIRVFRKKKNISQEEMAKALNLSPATVANYESGKTIPDIYTLRKIYRVLGISSKIILKQPEVQFLDLYIADEGVTIDENGKASGNRREIEAKIFNIYGCRKLSFCCVLYRDKVYLMNNSNIAEPSDIILARFCGDDAFVMTRYDGEKYVNISTGEESCEIYEIVARSLGEVEDYEIIE